MNMVFCRGCAKQIHETAPSCPHCGAVQSFKPTQSYATDTSLPNKQTSAGSLNKKFHITLIVAAAIGTVLLYTTQAFPLIGMATGISFGMSVRLFIAHRGSNFIRTNKIDWMLLLGFSIVALILMMASVYDFQALALIFVAVRALIMYFKIYSEKQAGDQTRDAK